MIHGYSITSVAKYNTGCVISFILGIYRWIWSVRSLPTEVTSTRNTCPRWVSLWVWLAPRGVVVMAILKRFGGTQVSWSYS